MMSSKKEKTMPILTDEELRKNRMFCAKCGLRDGDDHDCIKDLKRRIENTKDEMYELKSNIDEREKAMESKVEECSSWTLINLIYSLSRTLSRRPGFVKSANEDEWACLYFDNEIGMDGRKKRGPCATLSVNIRFNANQFKAEKELLEEMFE